MTEMDSGPELVKVARVIQNTLERLHLRRALEASDK